MPFISSRPTSKRRGTKDDTRPAECFESLPYENTYDQSTHNAASTPTLDLTDDTSPENFLVEVEHGLIIPSQLPTFDTTGLVLDTEKTDLAVLIHRHYRAFQSPTSLPNLEWTWKKATIEVVALRKAFPAIKEAEDTLLAMTAWFHFLCNIDDEIERMNSLGRVFILEQIIGALKATSPDRLHPTKHITPVQGITDNPIFKRLNISLHRKVPLITHKKIAISNHPAAIPNTAGQEELAVNSLTESDYANVLALASNFIRQCQVTLSPQTLPKVFTEVIDYLEALKEESAFRENTAMSSTEDYLRLRLGTIGLSPFFAILANTLVGIESQQAKEFKAGNNNETKDLRDDGSTASDNSDISGFWTSPLHKSLCDSIKCIVGLQNDVVGLNRDIENGDRLNLAVLLLEQRNETTENLQAILEARATAVSMHNTEMQHVMRTWADIEAANHSPAVQVYAQSLVALTRTFYTWATHTDRYQSKHTTISEIVSSVAQDAAVEGLRFKARVIRTRRSLQKLVTSHTK